MQFLTMTSALGTRQLSAEYVGMCAEDTLRWILWDELKDGLYDEVKKKVEMAVCSNPCNYMET